MNNLKHTQVRKNYDQWRVVGTCDSQCSSVITLRKHDDNKIEVYHSVGGSLDLYAGHCTDKQASKIGDAIMEAVKAGDEGKSNYIKKIGKITLTWKLGDLIHVIFSNEKNGSIYFARHGYGNEANEVACAFWLAAGETLVDLE